MLSGYINGETVQKIKKRSLWSEQRLKILNDAVQNVTVIVLPDPSKNLAKRFNAKQMPVKR